MKKRHPGLRHLAEDLAEFRRGTKGVGSWNREYRKSVLELYEKAYHRGAIGLLEELRHKCKDSSFASDVESLFYRYC